MPFTTDQLITVAQLGGFVFASIVLLVLLWQVFQVMQKGTLISRTQHEDVVKMLTEANVALRSDLQKSVAETGRLAAVVQKVADTLAEHDRDEREVLAAIKSTVEANNRFVAQSRR